MSAVTADVSMRVYGPEFTHKFILDTSAATCCTGYKGEPLVIDQNVDSVNPRFCHDTTSPHMVSTDVFVGVAKEPHTGAISDTEDLTTSGIEAWIEPTILGWKSAVFTNADAGKTVYWSSGALSATATDAAQLGHIMFIEDGYCFVKLITAVCASTG